MGVTPDRMYVDHRLTGSNRERPGLREALAVCRDGDTLVVSKLDRLARSLPDARAIAGNGLGPKVTQGGPTTWIDLALAETGVIGGVPARRSRSGARTGSIRPRLSERNSFTDRSRKDGR